MHSPIIYYTPVRGSTENPRSRGGLRHERDPSGVPRLRALRVCAETQSLRRGYSRQLGPSWADRCPCGMLGICLFRGLWSSSRTQGNLMKASARSLKSITLRLDSLQLAVRARRANNQFRPAELRGLDGCRRERPCIRECLCWGRPHEE